MAKRNEIQDTVRVECYRMSPAEIRDLKRWLRKTEGVAGFKIYIRKASPVGPELGELIGVAVLKYFAQYAGKKILDYVYDQVKAWVKAQRKKPFLITLDLNNEKRRIGSGKPSKRTRR